MTPEPMLEVDDLTVGFDVRDGWRRRRLVAVDRVSFRVTAGQTFGLVGESGSGKTTIGRSIVGLQAPDGGRIWAGGRDVHDHDRRRRPTGRDVQMVFQDPYSSLNPWMVVAEIVGEPLRVHTDLDRRARQQRVRELLEQVGLSTHHAERYPGEFSGGQRQRIAIARAIATDPTLVVCDEAVSALDVSTQSQVINLLEDLQADRGLTYLFIAHDLAVVRHISHQIGVMYLGQMMETGPAEQVYQQPRHPYTKALLSAVAVPDPVVQRRLRADRRASAEPISFVRPDSGCSYRLRCPLAVGRCAAERPEPIDIDGVSVACHVVTNA